MHMFTVKLVLYGWLHKMLVALFLSGDLASRLCKRNSATDGMYFYTLMHCANCSVRDVLQSSLSESCCSVWLEAPTLSLRSRR